ncbi:MAG: hypothetical protein ACR2JC_20895 [Chloroflexota bacterium]
MPLLIQDTIASLGPDGNLAPLARAPIHAQPATLPLYRKIGGVYYEVQGGDVYTLSNDLGVWSIALPWPSECKPATTWQLEMPDGAIYAGSVPDLVSGPVNVDTLVTTYGWTLAQSPTGGSLAP